MTDTPLEQVAEHDLYSRVAVAGGDERWRLESRIRFGKADVVEPGRSTMADFAQLVGHDIWDYSCIYFPFDLDTLRQGFYRSVRLTATFCDPDVIARHLAPSPGSTEIPFDGRPTTWGLGRSEMSWQLEPAEEAGALRPQGLYVMCLVQRPKTLTAVEVVLGVEVDVVRTFMVLNRRKATTRSPARFRLSFADNTFVELAG